MKPLQMRTPGLQQIFNQKQQKMQQLSQYEQHKRKLLKIYENRKSQLCYDAGRATQFQSLKQTKMKSFVHKFNRNNESIAKDNLKLLTKLQTVKSSLNKVTDEESKGRNFVPPFLKKRMFETEKQNVRISEKMKNMNSSLSQRRFIQDYAKSQKIKSRIMRYTTEESGVFLKSKKYFDDRDDHSNSVLSHKSNISRQSRSKSEYSVEPRKVVSKPALQKSAASHYRKQDILRNRVDTKQSNLASIKLRMKLRPNTCEQGNPENEAGQNQEQQTFFATQPKKNKIIRLLKNKL